MNSGLLESMSPACANSVAEYEGPLDACST